MKKYRVVFHLDEGGKGRVDMTLNNIENLITDLGEENVDVELVSNSEGVTAFLRVPALHEAKVKRLAAKGVRFAVCANSLRQFGLTEDALLDQAEVVPAGVGELVRKQAEGWAYIRP